MYYKQSFKILDKIKRAKRILINIHPHPDLDSVGSALALANILGKRSRVVCPEEIKGDFSFLKEFDKVKIIDFSKYDFSRYDLFLIIDASSYDRVTGDKSIQLPKILKIIIDHHLSNTLTGEIKLVDTSACATAEILYKIFLDWKTKIDKDIATALFSGLAGDTVFFRTPKCGREVFQISSDLLSFGADKELIIEKFYSSYELHFLKILGKFLDKLKFDRGRKFVWSAISYEEYLKLGKPVGGQSPVADMFFQSVKDADFGIAILESKRGETYVSLRSKPHYDASVMARALGGGGHKNAAGVTLFGNFNEIVKKVLKTAKNLQI